MAKIQDVMLGKTLRKSFAKHDKVLAIPNMLKIQKDSYNWFLDEGLREVFRDVDTITDYTGNLELSFLDYSMNEPPKYTVEECKERDATFAKPIKVRVRLHNKETDEIKEQEIFMGDFPLMTNGGTFVINGAERVIVSQIVRSPGMYYGDEVDKADQHIYSATVIPYRGAWLEYETDLNNVFYVRIDKNRKIPITCLIRALGISTDAQIKEVFGEDPLLNATLEKDTCRTREESLLEIYRKLRPGEPPTVESAESYLDALFFDARRYDVSKVGRYKFNKKMDIWSRLSGQTLAKPVTDPHDRRDHRHARRRHLQRQGARNLRRAASTKRSSTSTAARSRSSPTAWSTWRSSWTSTPSSTASRKRSASPCCARCSRRSRQTAGRKRSTSAAKTLFRSTLQRTTFLHPSTICARMVQGAGTKDDIDHLGNRRLRCVGELLQNQFRVGFTRLERVIRERMTIQDLDVVTPQSLINIRPVTAVIKEFFGSSPAVAVHGPEQPSGRADAQAPSVRARSRRSVERACIVRCA